MSKDSNRNDNIVCRKLLNQVNRNIINTIATDGNCTYHKVINRGYHRDCKRYIISKTETCLAEAYNSSLRGRFARFNRRTKSYSKSFHSVVGAVFLWMHREELFDNMARLANFGRNW